MCSSEEPPKGPPPDPALVAQGLRQMAFDLTPEALHLSSLQAGEPYGILMEFGIGGTVVTVMAFLDDTVSLYTSAGFCVLGGGQHPKSRGAGRAFLETSKSFLHLMHPIVETLAPDQGGVRFFVLNTEGKLAYDAKMETIETDALFPLFMKGQDVLTQIRLIADAGKTPSSTP